MNEVSKISRSMRFKINRAIQKETKLNKQDWEEIIENASTKDLQKILDAIAKRINRS